MAIKPDELRPITIGPDGKPLVDAPIQVQEPDEDAPPTAAVPSQNVPSNWSNQLRQRVTGSPVIPAEVAQQMPVWHKRTGAYEQGPSAAQPQFGIWQNAPSQRPDVPAIYKKAGVPLRTGDKLLPESAFDHNIPWAVKLPDGRVIQAVNQQEFGKLLARMLFEKGPVQDDNIQEPTHNYSANDIAAALDAGDDAGADWMMYQNYRAGNVTVQQYEDFANHRKTLGELLVENPDIGKFNNNPIKEKIQYISAQDYNEWANERNRGLTDNHVSFQEAHDDVEKLSSYLWQVKYARAQEFRKKYADEIRQGGFEQTFNAYGKGDPYYFPELPQNFLDWTEIPDEWLMKDSKGATVIGLDVPRFPAALKAQYEKAQQEHEAFLTSQLPDGYKAKIVQGGWTTPNYQIQFFTPDGQMITADGSQVDPMLFKGYFTDADIDAFKQWAIDNPEYYVDRIKKLAQQNPAMANAIIAMSYPEYTVEQVEGVTGILSTPDSEADNLQGKITGIRKAVSAPMTDVDNIKAFRAQIKNWFPELQIISEQQSVKQFNMAKNFIQTNMPDFMKAYWSGAAGMASSFGGMSSYSGNEGLGNLLSSAGNLASSALKTKEDRLIYNLIEAVPAINFYGALGTAVAMSAGGLMGVLGLTARATAMTGAKGFIARAGIVAMQSLFGTAAMRPFESWMEAGDTYNQAQQNGFSKDDSISAASEVFAGNLKLAGLDFVQLAASFVPLPGNNAAVRNAVLKGFLKYGKIGTKIGVIGLSEGGEELYQQSLQRLALGEPFDLNNWDDDMKTTFLVGAIMGGIMGGAGDIFGAKFNQKAKNKIQEVTGQTVTNDEDVTRILTETPQGQEIVNEVVQETIQETMVDQIALSQQRIKAMKARETGTVLPPQGDIDVSNNQPSPPPESGTVPPKGTPEPGATPATEPPSAGTPGPEKPAPATTEGTPVPPKIINVDELMKAKLEKHNAASGLKIGDRIVDPLTGKRGTVTELPEGRAWNYGLTLDGETKQVPRNNMSWVWKEGDVDAYLGKVSPTKSPVPPEPAKPAGEAPATKPAAMSRDEITAQVKAQYPDATPEQINAAVAAKEAKMARTSPAMAEIDTKLADINARIKSHSDKGIFERGAINDPEVKQAYADLMEAAGLYIKKGVLTVEEFAKELGVKVNDLVKQAWAEASAVKGESDQLKAALGISEEAGHIPVGRRAISEVEMQTTREAIIERVNAARGALEERKGAIKVLREQQMAAGMAAGEKAGGGEAGYLASRGAMRGEAEKVYTGLGQAEFEQSVRDWVIDAPKRAYAENPAIFNTNRKGEFFTVANAQEALINLMKGESLPEFQVKLLEKVYGIDFIKTIKNTPKGLVLDILGIAKSLMAFIDHSFPGRQGWIINSSNPEIFWRNIKDATASFWSKGYFDGLKARVMGDPNFKTAKAWGVEFTDTGMDRVMREESYPSRIMDNVPGMVQSNRSFTWAGNAQRLDAWNKYSKWLGPEATDAELKWLAGFINEVTGRGNLGKLTVLAEEANTIMFSPKLFVSRFQVPLRGVTSALSPRLRSIYWRNVGTSIGVTLTTLALFKGLSEIPALKDKIYVETDLRSSDIGKLIIGDTHIDLTGGNSQLIYLLARLAAGTRKSGGSNEYDTTAAIELQRYLRYKNAPVFGVAADWAVGKDVMGEKFGTGKYWQGKIPIPMSIMDVFDAISVSGLGGIGVLPLTTYGIGVNTYEQRAMTEEKRLGAALYSDEQLMDATVKAKEKYTKPGVNDPLGEEAAQTTLDKLAKDKYTLADYRTYLRTAGVPVYKITKLQEYFNECIPLFDKWQKDEAATGSKQSYTATEKAQAVFWGLDQTKGSPKNTARAKLAAFGLPKEAAPWLY